MAVPSFSTAQVDYLQRVGLHLGPAPRGVEETVAPPDRRRLLRVTGRGRAEPLALPGERPALGSESLLSGLYAYRLPLALRLRGDPAGTEIQVGTWSPLGREQACAATLDARLRIVTTLLAGAYPGVEHETAPEALWEYEQAGLALGAPAPQPPDPTTGALPLDRVVRALSGREWGALVLAQPVEEAFLQEVRHSLLNESRLSQGGAVAAGSPSPLTQHYVSLLDAYVQALTLGQAEGCWRTAVYLFGSEESYPQVASAWAGLFSGVESLPEPVRVFDLADARRLGDAWALPDAPGAAGPGAYRHPFQYQTLLTTRQLASYVHLPALETRGFRLSLVPRFDVCTPQRGGGDAVAVGRVVEDGRATPSVYAVPTRDLNRHALVAGVTGAGKTHTTRRLLVDLWEQGVPFLVIEPAKTEYRRLLDHPRVGPDLRVFTLGDESTSPFRLNPFEVEPSVGVLGHIDLLKSVFGASFGLWNPLPQVLERCLHAVYEDYGWDTVHDTNERLGDRSLADRLELVQPFPTLGDLYAKVDEVVSSLGYHERLTSDIKAALMTRLNGLRIGAKGAMLDTPRSIPMEELLARPTIVELDPIGDDDERAFLMGLLLTRLYEHRRGRGTFAGERLGHVVVVEEAHRLLTSVPRSNNPEVGDVRGKAVETFTNMLSEVRAYGQGFVVVEQIPTKLAPDVCKNTNLKVVHRIVAGDDRATLAGTMNMDDAQSAALATLRRGRAAVFAEGDDHPVLVDVPEPAEEPVPAPSSKSESDLAVSRRMEAFRNRDGLRRVFRTAEGLPMSPVVARWRREAADLLARRDVQEALSAFVLALALGSPARKRGEALLAFLRARMPSPDVSEEALQVVSAHATIWYAAHFGRRYRWLYSVADGIARSLGAVLAALCRGAGDRETEPEVGRFREQYRRACRRTVDPFPVCAGACPGRQCLFRWHAARLLHDPQLARLFDQGLASAGLDDRWDGLRAVTRQAVVRLTDDAGGEAERRGAGLCYASQYLDRRPDLLPAARTLVLERLLHPPAPEAAAATAAVEAR